MAPGDVLFDEGDRGFGSSSSWGAMAVSFIHASLDAASPAKGVSTPAR